MQLRNTPPSKDSPKIISGLSVTGFIRGDAVESYSLSYNETKNVPNTGMSGVITGLKVLRLRDQGNYRALLSPMPRKTRHVPAPPPSVDGACSLYWLTEPSTCQAKRKPEIESNI
jgi:hypothetical protein